MSVANIILEPQRVRLVSDTLAYRNRAPVRFGRKVRICEDIGVAFTVRGLVALGDRIESRADEWACFESMVQSIAAFLPGGPVHYFPSGAEVTVLGWHAGAPKASRLLALVNDGKVTVRRIDLATGVYLAPSLGAQKIPAAMSDEQLTKVAQLQQAIALRHGLNMCVGGDIEVTEITATGLAVRKIGEYPDKAMTAARIAKLPEGDLSQAAA